MRYLVHEPGPPLGDCVAYVWSLSDAPAHARERILPTGTLELVINLADDQLSIYADPNSDAAHRLPGAVVSGCYTRPFVIDTRAHASLIGVHFKPGAAGGLLGVPPGTLANTHVALEDVWGKGANELRERLVCMRDPHARIRSLERALVQRLDRAPRRRSAIGVALAALARPRAEVADVARALGISRRRLVDVFSEDAGISPKRYAKVCRFQRALARSAEAPPSGWAELAVECGYYDQAHLCRDWLELTGLSPAAFVALRTTPVKDHHLALPV